MDRSGKDSVVYHEEQQFRQWWVGGVVVIASGFCWYAFIKQVLFGVPVGNRPAPNSVVIVIWLIVGIGVPLLFWSLTLITQVRADGVYVRMTPIHRKFQVILFTDLQTYAVHNYHPLREFGGWGIRYDRTGKAYTVSGHRGILFTLNSGAQLLIGSQQPEAFFHALQKYAHRKD